MSRVTTELRRTTDRHVTVDGIGLHYNDVGTGPVILCTHGGGPGATAWGTLSSAIPLFACDFRLLLLDLPNFGASDKHVRIGERRPDEFVAELSARFLDAVGITGPVSYYSSSGGAPGALRFALDHPDRVHRVVAQAFAPGMTPQRDSPGHRATALFAECPTHEAMEHLFDLFVPDPARRTAEAVTARWEAATAPGHLTSRGELARLADSAALAEELGALEAEVLFLWGADDGIVPVERVLTALRTVPRAQAHIWGDRTGHLVPFEQPAAFTRVVRDFLLA
ncbi:alpha/beta fold hydrolase [Pseudonocardia sp. ICBG1122]|nr:alpha/beta fold hydrolase [Pseudonocardia pini]